MTKKTPIPLACADFSFPLLAHDKVLDLISMLEMDGIDIGLFEGRSHLWPSKEFRSVGKSAAALAAKLEARGLRAADIYLILGADFESQAINHPDAAVRRKVREIFRRALEYAVVAGSRHLSALPGVHFSSESKKDSLARCADELAWRVEAAQQAGIVFAVEAHIGSIIPTPKDAAKLVQMTPGLTLTLDYCHFTRVGVTDEKIEPLVQCASHFHVRGARKGRLQTSFKDNAIDYARVLQVMRDTGYQGFLGIEYVWIDWEHCNETDNLSETVLFRDYLRAARDGA